MAITDRRGVSVNATDSPIAGSPNPGLAIKAPARAATTANIVLTGLQTIDGVALAAGDRVLVKSQTDATTNGLYNASTSVWTRTIDAAGNADWANGTVVYVALGTANGDKSYILTALDPVTIGTSNLTFLFAASSGVPPTRNVNTTAPISGGGTLAADLTLALGINSSLQVTGGALAVAPLSKVSHQWVNAFNASGIPQLAQPAFSDISGLPTTLAGYGIVSPLPIAQGGTSGAVASGTLLDNITGFNAIGLVRRTGAGAYSLIAAGQTPGTNTSDSATSGNAGEYVASDVPTASAIALTSNSAINVASISLSAGDWDVSGTGCFNNIAGSTALTAAAAAISTTSGTMPAFEAGAAASWLGSATGNGPHLSTGAVRFSLAATGTAYLVAIAIFSTSTASVYGSLHARRVR